MEYDMELRWREESQHILPDVLSRLARQQKPEDDVDDAFPDHFTLGVPAREVQPRGPRLGGRGCRN